MGESRGRMRRRRIRHTHDINTNRQRFGVQRYGGVVGCLADYIFYISLFSYLIVGKTKIKCKTGARYVA